MGWRDAGETMSDGENAEIEPPIPLSTAGRGACSTNALGVPPHLPLTVGERLSYGSTVMSDGCRGSIS